MGSKKLKAIAVFGEKAIPVADPEKLASLRGEYLARFKEPGHISPRFKDGGAKKADYRGMLQFLGFCGNNFRVNQMVEFGLGWSQQEFHMVTCPKCPIACCYDLEIKTGPHKGYVASVCGGTEALEGAGSILGITEPGTIYYLCDVYDRLGIEGSVAGCVMAMAFEAYEKGLITTKDTDGLELKWGDAKVAEALVRKMVNREGFGEILARGIKEAAEYIGGDAPSFAVNVKGAGMSLHEWRSVWGVLLGQITGSGAGWPAQGADAFATQADAGYPSFTGRFDRSVKPMETKQTGIIKMLNDSGGFCMFTTMGLREVIRLQADTLNAITGWDYTTDELREIGERALQLERAFNVRHGLKPEDDWTVPERLVSAPDDGPAKGISIKPYLEGMVKEYHKLMGWDAKTGKPLISTLRRVRLDDVIKDLWK
jgi:aldehyde:ferredoxin oxidoreductase